MNKHGSRYSYFRNLTVDGLVGRTLTLYKSVQPAVLTLPTISEEKESKISPEEVFNYFEMISVANRSFVKYKKKPLAMAS